MGVIKNRLRCCYFSCSEPVFLIYTSHLTHFQDIHPIATWWGAKWKLFFMPALWLRVVYNNHCVPSLPGFSSGKLFWYFTHETVLSFLTCPMFLMHAFRVLKNILSFTHRQIIKLPFQVRAAGTSSFLWSYCKSMCPIVYTWDWVSWSCWGWTVLQVKLSQ